MFEGVLSRVAGSIRPRKAGAVLIFSALVLPAVVALSPAQAQIGSDRYSSMVVEAATGNVISTANPDEIRFPASLTKIMTLYMTFEALRDRRISLDELVPVSRYAASMSPSKLGLLPGTRITVQQAIMALVTKSANDAACALGELLGGDEARFAQTMTLRARALGMSRTVFRNASGLPDPGQVTTARDLALLARHLVQDYPDQYYYFSLPSFAFQRRVIPNHDRMLLTYPGADGIKTGYTEASGFNLVTSAVRGDVRLIGVVLGAARSQERDLHMAALLDAGFEQMGVPVEAAGAAMASRRLQLFAAAQAATVPATATTAAAMAERPSLVRVSAVSRPLRRATLGALTRTGHGAVPVHATTPRAAKRAAISHGSAMARTPQQRRSGEARAASRSNAG